LTKLASARLPQERRGTQNLKHPGAAAMSPPFRSHGFAADRDLTLIISIAAGDTDQA
jgi:hypothetical protein